MNGFVSLKQVEKCRAEVGEALAPLPVFGGGSVVGETALANVGKLLLPPGAYFVAFAVQARWKYSASVTAAVVIGGDARFRGPRAVGEHEIGAMECYPAVCSALRQVGNVRAANEPDWDQSASRTLTGFGTVVIPPGSPQPVELWGSAEGIGRTGFDKPAVSFTDGELVAIALAPSAKENM